jgi:muramoyltetrapeptide carboxypeptidase
MTATSSHLDSRTMLIPEPLQFGDTVAVVAPSGPVEPEILSSGVTFLKQKGFRVIEGFHVCERNGYLAGTDDQRCTDLNAMLHNPVVRGIFFARGGYGAMRLLEDLDLESVRNDPKLLVGMSDATALQLSLLTRCGLISFSGPMIAGQVGAGLDAVSEESLIRALTEPIDGRNLLEPMEMDTRVLRPGRAGGILVGGCLSLVTALLGTGHSPDYSGTILFLEDVNEPSYRLDRMLIHLKLAGVLDKIGGLVAGHFLGPTGEDLSTEINRILLDVMEDNPIPVLTRVPHGHTLPNLTMPHGAPVRLDTERGSLTVDLDYFAS